MTVYIVTSGDRDDCQISGAFSTREKAQAFIDKGYVGEIVASNCGDEIKEMDVDELENVVKKTTYLAYADIETGTISWEREWQELVHPHETGEAHVTGQEGRNSACAVSYVSAEHARELVLGLRKESAAVS